MRFLLIVGGFLYILWILYLIFSKYITNLEEGPAGNIKKDEKENPPILSEEETSAAPVELKADNAPKIYHKHTTRKKRKAMKAKTKYSKKAEKTIKKAVKKFDKGELHSGSKTGPVVTSPKQMIAIGISEAKRKGERVPKKKK